MSMFSIRIDDALYVDHCPVRSTPKVPQCTVSIIEAQGFSFEQALCLILPLASRKGLQEIFVRNGYQISKEEIQSVAKKHNISL